MPSARTKAAARRRRAPLPAHSLRLPPPRAARPHGARAPVLTRQGHAERLQRLPRVADRPVLQEGALGRARDSCRPQSAVR
eukprot:scaffold229053_cov32-Tisochrysis_lutea.AAC.2